VSTLSHNSLPVSAILRTRMSWIRTSLAIIVTAFLLVRGGFTGAEPAVLAALAGALGVLVVATSLTRFRLLGTSAPRLLRRQVPTVVAGGILALAVVAGIQLVLAAQG
jgi:uncharacterized membrane protein YidH (DUF202 family)